ncbi:MAG: enoyl-CoA hydratase-related protein, partial [Acidobacteriota bacterium]|nr:enoyl-CoA hydratase-related protein [Acidobacteriota bacterium]
MIVFETDPSRYRHWRLTTDGAIAELTLDVDEDAGLFEGYQLKQNSYDLGVDIELADAVQRLRFEHPAVKVVVLRSGKERVFSAGANIGMLAGASHAHKVNFCKFTNETRNALEDASRYSNQRYLAAVTGTAAGGGYELVLATDHLVLADDGRSVVALPELPLLAVLPGTGGLTRLTDKRKIRRDRVDVFCGLEEGVRGARALEWHLVDELVPSSRFDAAVRAKVQRWVDESPASSAATGIRLTPMERQVSGDGLRYTSLHLDIDRRAKLATLRLMGPDTPAPESADEIVSAGAEFWSLRLARELDDAILHLRLNEPDVGVLVFTSDGDPRSVLSYDRLLERLATHWLVREIRLLWKRVLKRLDVTSRSLIALVEPGNCFAGTLVEVVLACDRAYMLSGPRDGDDRA